MSPLIVSLIALTSVADPKVRLEFHAEQPNSKRWAEVAFNEYSFKSTGNQADTEKRTRAQLDIMGQAARLLSKEDPEGTVMTMRTFYVKDNMTKSRLSISVIPNSATTSTSQDTAGQLTMWTEKAIALNIDLSKLPSGVPDAVYLGCLKAVVSKANTAATNEAITASAPVTDTEPPI